MENQHIDKTDKNREEPLNLPVNPVTNLGISNLREDDGAEFLVDRYNINDKAHSDSSLEDFIPTASNFHHAEKPEDHAADDN